MPDFTGRYRKSIAPVLAYGSDIQMVSAEGSWLTDVDGKRYLDFACGISVTNLGHRHPHVTAAVRAQLDRLWHAGGAYLYESLITAAERIVAVSPDGIEQILFMNSGAEAVEAAVKLARRTTGRQGVVVFRGGFHGRTMGAATYTTSKATYRQGYHPLLPSVFVAPFPHPYRWGVPQEEADQMALDELTRLFAHEITPGEVGAFLVEPLQGEGGYYPASQAFLSELRAVADDHGILLLFDEIQTGFGRTGDWFASQVYDIKPDVLILGKAIANGLPLSAVGTSNELFSRWPPGAHGTTFGGNPLSCAAATATVEALTDVLPQVGKLSEHTFSRLADMATRHPTIGEVRGLGMMIGVELIRPDRRPDADAFSSLSRRAREEGLIILSCGPDGNVIRLVPPLNISTGDLDAGLDIIDRALGAYEASASRTAS